MQSPYNIEKKLYNKKKHQVNGKMLSSVIFGFEMFFLSLMQNITNLEKPVRTINKNVRTGTRYILSTNQNIQKDRSGYRSAAFTISYSAKHTSLTNRWINEWNVMNSSVENITPEVFFVTAEVEMISRSNWCQITE